LPANVEKLDFLRECRLYSFALAVSLMDSVPSNTRIEMAHKKRQ